MKTIVLALLLCSACPSGRDVVNGTNPVRGPVHVVPIPDAGVTCYLQSSGISCVRDCFRVSQHADGGFYVECPLW